MRALSKIGFAAVETLQIALWKTFRRLFAYNPPMGEMRRAIARDTEEKQRDRFVSTLVIAAAIIAAVRLARDDIGTPSPRVLAPSPTVLRWPGDDPQASCELMRPNAPAQS